MRPRNNGLLIPTGGENSEKADRSMYDVKRQSVNNKMQYYSDRLTNYLIQNEGVFPELNNNGPYWKQAPDFGPGYKSPVVFNRTTRAYHLGGALAAGLRLGDSRYPYMVYGSDVFYRGPRPC